MKYLDFRLHLGKNTLYNMIDVNCNEINVLSSPYLKDEITDYFFPEKAKELVGEKYCLNLEKVKDVDCSGVHFLLKLYILDKMKDKNGVVLLKCPINLRQLLDSTEMDNFFKFVDNTNEL